MRYQNLSSFRNHLNSAAPHHLCRKYLIAMSDDFERNKAIDAVLSFLPGTPTRFSGVECDLKQCLDAMYSMSLLGESIVVLDELEKLSKKEIQTLCDEKGTPAGYLIFGARSKTALMPLIEKEGVILDLLEEKPWDKEKRLADELMQRAKQFGKRLDFDAASLLLERLGTDSALLSSEIDKLICFAGEKSQITREEILQISPLSKSATLWQTAEDVVWEGGEFPSLDSTTFHALVPALRGQLHLGLTLATLIESKCPSSEWNQFLPKLWPKILEKRSSQAARLGSSHFQKGLDKLFEIELLSRTKSTHYRALLDLFRGSYGR
jgi:DNA polymerase-3 subunit delta